MIVNFYAQYYRIVSFTNPISAIQCSVDPRISAQRMFRSRILHCKGNKFGSNMIQLNVKDNANKIMLISRYQLQYTCMIYIVLRWTKRWAHALKRACDETDETLHKLSADVLPITYVHSCCNDRYTTWKVLSKES